MDTAVVRRSRDEVLVGRKRKGPATTVTRRRSPAIALRCQQFLEIRPGAQPFPIGELQHAA